MSNGGLVNYDPERLASLKFNPLLCESFKNFSLCKDNDPDTNFYSNSFDCEYYTEISFNNMLAEIKNRLNFNIYNDRNSFSNNLSFLHLNIRSIKNKIDNFSNFLGRLNIKFPVIGISETWLDDSFHCVDIPGYNFLHKHRNNRTDGGVALYLADYLNFKLREDLGFTNNKGAESLFIEINRRNEKNVIVGIVYRPPDQNLNEFLCDLDIVLNKFSNENKSVFLLGDWNVNIMNHSKHEATSQFLDTLYSKMFFPLISRPTRLTAHKASLIDNIFTNDPLSHAISGLFLNDISDHLPIFSFVSDKYRVPKAEKYISFRVKNEINVRQFQAELKNLDWQDVHRSTDSSRAYKIFIEKFTCVYDRCFPMKKVKARKSSIGKPWITNGLLRSIRKKNNLYKRFLNNPNSQIEIKYKQYRNKLNHSLRIAKRLYFENKIEQHKNDIKSTWKVLNEILNRKNCQRKLPSIFSKDSIEISDPKEVANQFCKYFTNIGPSLASKIPKSTNSFSQFLPDRLVNSVFLELVNEKEIIDVCNSFRSSAAPGYDNISMGTIKESINFIIRPLVSILNLSITTGAVPDDMKIARVIPLYKSGAHNVFTNYRPISILSAFSKILEKIMFNRLLEFLNRHQILSDNQYGFRKKHSTSYALTKLFDKLSCAIDNREIAVGVFIDLSKAFDTVDHEILLEKLEHYGIRGLAHNWFRSYLSNRQQYVEFNSTFSPCQQIRCGVPQGSILGPLLFLVYINDLCNVSTALEFILFADDTNIFFSHKDRSTLSAIFNLEMSKLSDWCRANKLSINLKKSNFMVFQPRQKRQKFDLAFSIDGSPIERVKETVFLGVVIDENLTWKPHILNVSRKISKSIGILYKSSFCLSTAALRILYYSLIYPYLIYCVSVWGSTYNSNIKKLLHFRKKQLELLQKFLSIPIQILFSESLKF